MAFDTPRFDWTRDEIRSLYELPLDTLIGRALQIKQANWADGKIQKSQLLSIKTGGCAENCGYCSQSSHFDTGLEASKLMPLSERWFPPPAAPEKAAQIRFCMGAAWRELKDRDLPKVAEMISAVKAEGLETCVTLGMLGEGQAEKLADAGLDYYNHNLDTSREYYGSVVTTRTYEDRIDTLGKARRAGMKLCTGGILGMGEGREDRIGLIHELALAEPASGKRALSTCLSRSKARRLAPARKSRSLKWPGRLRPAGSSFPKSWVRLSAGREGMSEGEQALCLLAGANSIFVGDRLLTTDNPGEDRDASLLAATGFEAASHDVMEV